jgi:BirA family biotin operon repressor/biotin-[acetyl-CoA-carboxylase] ligase
VALLFSLFITPKRTDRHGWIPLIAGMAVAQTLRELTSSQDYFTKWPNDVLSEYGKVCGVLCEKYGDGIIVGIGINVSTLPEELPTPIASSAFITNGIELDRNQLLAALLKNFAALIELWESGADLKGRYRALSATISSEIKAILPGGREIEGLAIGVGEDGELALESGDLISVGDITHLRSR